MVHFNLFFILPGTFLSRQNVKGQVTTKMKYSNIGGQAVMEGVMMRNGENYAVAVRTADKKIVVEKKTHKPFIRNKNLQKLPLIRGVINFVDSLVLGMSSLMFSAEFFAEETPQEVEDRLAEELKKVQKKADKMRREGKTQQADSLLAEFEKKAETERAEIAKRTQEAQESAGKKEEHSVLMGLTVAFSLVLSIGLFMLLPYFLSRGLRRITSSEALISILEAVLRMLIFFGYMFLISRMKDIQRTFMYHGAEHKCINCIEHGMELNVENVRKSSRQHKRCGTSFLLIVIVISVIFFLFIRVRSPLWRIVIRLLLLPVIAGVSFEFIRLAGKYDNALVNLLSAPGLCLQRLTTKEPDDSMIEVGIASVEAIFDWRSYLNENFGTHYPPVSAEDAAAEGTSR